MNLLFISTTYPTPCRPGQGAFNASFVDALRTRHHVEVIAPVPWTQLCTPFSFRRKAESIQTDTHHPTFWYPPKLLRRYFHYFYKASIQKTIQRIIQNRSFDAVVGYWLHPDGTAVVDVAQQLNVPSVLLCGGSDLLCLTQNKGRRPEILTTIDRCEHLVVVSQHLQKTAESMGVPKEKITVCRRGVDRQIFSPGSRLQARKTLGVGADEIVLLWVGRLEKVKNPRMLLKAMISLHRRWGERLRLIVVGDGRLRRSLQRMIGQSQLHSHVQFDGLLQQAELARRYQASDCVLLTSDSEGIPNVLLEAIACERPFVATDVGGVREIVTPGLDTLVPPGDVSAFVDAVVDCIESKVKPRTLWSPGCNDQFARQVEVIIAQAIEAKRDQRLLLPGLPRPELSQPGEAVA